MQISQVLMLGLLQLPACTLDCASLDSLCNSTRAQYGHAGHLFLKRELCPCQNRERNIAKSMFYTRLIEQTVGNAGDYMDAGGAQQCQHAV